MLKFKYMPYKFVYGLNPTDGCSQEQLDDFSDFVGAGEIPKEIAAFYTKHNGAETKPNMQLQTSFSHVLTIRRILSIEEAKKIYSHFIECAEHDMAHLENCVPFIELDDLRYICWERELHRIVIAVEDRLNPRPLYSKPEYLFRILNIAAENPGTPIKRKHSGDKSLSEGQIILLLFSLLFAIPLGMNLFINLIAFVGELLLGG